MVVNERELLKRVMKQCSTLDSKDEVEMICDIFIKEMFQCFINEESFQYCNYPLFKVKRSKNTMNINSPRTPKNDRIIVSVKVPLNTKSGIK